MVSTATEHYRHPVSTLLDAGDVAREGKNPRTGLPITREEKHQIDDNDGSIYEHGEQE